MSAIARSRRAWGWHPLTDEWAARVVADAAVRPGELVLDLGAGYGVLTAHLVERGAASSPSNSIPRAPSICASGSPGGR